MDIPPNRIAFATSDTSGCTHAHNANATADAQRKRRGRIKILLPFAKSCSVIGTGACAHTEIPVPFGIVASLFSLMFWNVHNLYVNQLFSVWDMLG